MPNYSYIFARLLASVIILFVCFPAHEFAHAKVAALLGDRTQALQGRLTLNPFRHLEWLGSILVILTGCGWAKPVMTQPRYFRNERRDMSLVAAAGPLTNFLIAVVGIILYKLAKNLFTSDMLLLILFQVILINVNLFIFNLIPVPPLDGSKILYYLYPPSSTSFLVRYQRYLPIFLAIIAVTGIIGRISESITLFFI